MQAIQTKYLGPTNFKGSRIKATCQAKSRIFSWDCALNPAGNHVFAAKALATELGWNYGKWIGGGLPDGSTVFVCDARFNDESFVVELDDSDTLAADLAMRAPEDENLWKPDFESE